MTHLAVQRAWAWRLLIGCAVLVILGSLVAFALSDPPVSVTRLADGRRVTVEAVALGDREALRGGLLLRLLYRVLPPQYRDYLRVRAFTGNAGETALRVWMKCQPPLPADEALVALPLDGTGAYGNPEDADDDTSMWDSPTFVLNCYPRREGVVRLRLFAKKRRDDGWSASTTPFRQPARDELRLLGEVVVSNPGRTVTTTGKPVHLPAKVVQRGIGLEVLEVRCLPERRNDLFPRDRVRLRYHFLRNGRPNSGWSNWWALNFRDPTGNQFDGEPEQFSSSSDAPYDLSLPRLNCEPTFRLEARLIFGGGLKDLPVGTTVHKISNIPIPRRGEVKTVSVPDQLVGEDLKIEVGGPGAWKLEKPPATGKLPLLRLRYSGPFSGVPFEVVDQRGRLVKPSFVGPSWSSGGIQEGIYELVPLRGATRLTLRYSRAPELTMSLLIPNPYYQESPIRQ